jgi:septum formation protein
MKIILGSSSLPRRQTFESAGYEFITMSPDIDEKAIRSEDLYNLPLLIANAKREALVNQVTEPYMLITADQVVVCDGELHEKPVTEEDVKKVFAKYNAGHPAETVSAIVVTNTENGKYLDGVDIAKVFFKPVPDEIISQFIETKIPFRNAGAFDIKHPLLVPYIERIEGTEDSVMGLPLKLVDDLMKQLS